MSEYIKRETAIRHLEQLKADESHNCQYERACAVNSCIEKLKRQKSAEVEPIVRCRDCIYDNTFSCPLSFIENHNLCFTNHDPDFYCAKGRKEGDDE